MKNKQKKVQVKAWANTHKGVITNFGSRLDIYDTKENAKFGADSNGFKVARITIHYSISK